jgi:NADH:ubiquinone oxidoreductase subunit 4 (subunit M)
MLLSLLILLPILGTFIIFIFYTDKNYKGADNVLKITALTVTIIDLFISLII